MSKKHQTLSPEGWANHQPSLGTNTPTYNPELAANLKEIDNKKLEDIIIDTFQKFQSAIREPNSLSTRSAIEENAIKLLYIYNDHIDWDIKLENWDFITLLSQSSEFAFAVMTYKWDKINEKFAEPALRLRIKLFHYASIRDWEITI